MIDEDTHDAEITIGISFEYLEKILTEQALEEGDISFNQKIIMYDIEVEPTNKVMFIKCNLDEELMN